MAGVTAAVDWIAGLTATRGDRRERLLAAMGAVEAHLAGLLDARARRTGGDPGRAGARVRGPAHLDDLIRGRGTCRPRPWPAQLAAQGIAVWDGDNYARELMARFGLDQSGGAIRASLVLYNDAADVDRLVEAVAALAGPRR